MSARIIGVLFLVVGTGLGWSGGASEEIRQKIPHRITKASSEVTVDGQLNEAAWKDALQLALDYEVEPGENVAPPVKTEVFLTFSEKELLVAFKCYDPDPSKIRARLNDRDSNWSDDWVGIMIDTFNDERRGYELMVNPLGVQSDAINDDQAGNYDLSWNAIWDSAGRITEEGYIVEMAIPFSQLRFQPNDGPQTWGFDGYRSYPRGDRHHMGLFPRTRGGLSYLSQEEKLVGFENTNPGRNIEVVPTATSSRNDSLNEEGTGLESGDANSEVGVTARWGITPNITINAAVNPDFSQIEADSVRLNINEQFTLFFKETRPFFLESADYFNTRMRLIHTRSVADPSSALKTTGRVGDHTFGAFVAVDDVTNVIVPGTEGSTSSSFATASTNNVVRYRYNIGKNASIGALFSDREGRGGYYNRVLALDANLRFSDYDTLNLNVASSETQYSEEMLSELSVEAIGDELGLKDKKYEDSGLSFNYQHNRRNWHLRAAHNSNGPEFRADMGFIPQVGSYKSVAGGGYKWYGMPGSFFRKINLGGDWDQSRTTEGQMLEEELESFVNFEAPHQIELNMHMGSRVRVYQNDRYEQNFYGMGINGSPSGNLGFNANINISDHIDFTHERPAERLNLNGGFRYNFGKHLRLNLNHRYSTLDVDEGGLFTTNVSDLRVNYHFNRRMMVRTIIQYTDISRNVALYEVTHDGDDETSVDASTRDFFSQLLFSYKLNPQTVAFAGYTDSYYSADERESLVQQDRTFFVKFGYAWSK